MLHRSFESLVSGFYLFALLCSGVLAAQDVYGPTDFVRGKGKPETVQDTFLAEPGSGFTLVVHNGNPDKDNKRVTSAAILLNGDTIFSPEDFKKEVYRLEQPVSLQSENQLEVRVAGKPGSFLTLSVVGELLNHYPVADAGLDQSVRG